jgi:sugar O-acyltransferase (sialic acid O-acetyltransferase NeuD family)
MNCSLPVIILGAGGHAKVVINALLTSNREILGVTDPNRKVGEKVLGVKVLGDDSIVFQFTPSSLELVNGIGALPDSTLRSKITAVFREKGYTFATVIHPQTIIAPDVVLAEGVQLMAGSIIQPGSSIGHDTIVNTRVSIDHDCIIGNGCHIAPGTVVNGNVTIDQGCFIGAGSCVTQNITIGREVVVAAGSVIHRDLPSFVRVIQKRSS